MFHRMMNYGELEAKPTAMLTKDVIKKLLPKYKRHDDLIVVQEQSWEDFKKAVPISVAENENSPFSIDEDELASLVCQTIQKPICRRLAIERRVKDDNYRSPSVKLILGDNGIVRHQDNHILYQFDVTKCMFSFGNVSEKLRVAALDCSQEIVVDLFAGIGYFTLPFLVHSKAKHVYACEWNPNAVEALRKNLILNKIKQDRYTVIEGDNRSNRPENVAQRVILGILPSCLEFMKTALDCVDKTTGAILHCHDLVETKLQSSGQMNAPSTGRGDSTTIPLADNSFNPGLGAPSEVGGTSSDSAHYLDSQSILEQSFTSNSTSSHSTVEKLSTFLDESKLQTTGNDNDNSFQASTKLNNFTINNSSHIENGNTCTKDDNVTPCNYVGENNSSSTRLLSSQASISESPMIVDNNNDRYLVKCSDSIDCAESFEITDVKTMASEVRAQMLIARIVEDLDRCNLVARLEKVQPVKSYAPHITHVVFDIKVEPKFSIQPMNDLPKAEGGATK